jgi:uncharacterized protein (TIGR02594 family)
MAKKELTTEQKIAFIKQLYCPARALAAETGCSWELILAQAAQECGWGGHLLEGSNNVFNIKADSSWHGDKRLYNVWEEVHHEKVWVDQWFRVYPTLLDSLRDRQKFLKDNPTYTKHGLFDEGTKGDFVKEAKALKAAGYATASNYVDKLIEVRDGRTMKKAIAAAQKEGCGVQLPVIEVFLKDGGKVPLANAKINVTLNGRSNDAVTDAAGGIAIRIAPNSTGAIQIKVLDPVLKTWATVDPVAIPNPFKSLTVTLLAPTIHLPTSTCVHDKPPAAKPAAAAPAPAVKAPPHAQAPVTGGVKIETYEVKKGDTLAKTAGKYGIRYKSIADLNNIDSPFIIREHQVLKIPVPQQAATPAGGASHHAAAAASAHPAASASAPAHPAEHAPASASAGLFGDLKTKVHALYYRDEADKPKTDVMSAMKAPWMQNAEDEFKAKVRRVVGKGNNQHIIEYFKATDLNKRNASTDETAWCAAFCNWCLVKAGFAGSNNALAVSFKDWGRPTRGNKPALGAVALVKFKNGKHHVTFVSGITKDGLRLATLGGNQGDNSEVTHSHVPLSWVECFRYPSKYPDYDEDYVLHDVQVDGAPLTAANTHK